MHLANQNIKRLNTGDIGYLDTKITYTLWVEKIDCKIFGYRINLDEIKSQLYKKYRGSYKEKENKIHIFYEKI